MAPLVLTMLVPLWGDAMPGPKPTAPEGMPGLYFYPAAKETNTGCAVVVCPGGGYGALAIDHEGKQVAEFFNKHGVSAIILKYRIADKTLKGPIQPAPMLDVQRAIRTVRFRAKDYGIDPARIGVMGFSAGGHLASTAATHFDAGDKDAKDPIERVSCRPDFAILAYAVITMGPKGHGGTRNNLIGPKADEKLADFYSSEKQVTKETPPTFLMHTAEDKGVPLENSRLFEEACKKNGVPVVLKVYDKGPHGVGLALNRPEWAVSKWSQDLLAWMGERKLLNK